MDTGIYELDHETNGLQNCHLMLLREQNCDFRCRMRTMIFLGKSEKIFDFLFIMTYSVTFV